MQASHASSQKKVKIWRCPCAQKPLALRILGWFEVPGNSTPISLRGSRRRTKSTRSQKQLYAARRSILIARISQQRHHNVEPISGDALQEGTTRPFRVLQRIFQRQFRLFRLTSFLGSQARTHCLVSASLTYTLRLADLLAFTAHVVGRKWFTGASSNFC